MRTPLLVTTGLWLLVALYFLMAIAVAVYITACIKHLVTARRARDRRELRRSAERAAGER